MLSNELEHLELILNKKPIVATVSAQDLIDRPEVVKENYLEHVRSFVVLKRSTVSSEDDQITADEYEKRLLKLVKERAAAKGYITADFGYGKTSTALFVWHRCEEAGLVAVPPFQIQKLDQLISATYGWVRYKLSVSYPAMVTEAETIYQKYVSRDIETHGENEEQRRALRKAYAEGRYTLELQAADYINYFTEMTQLVERAGFGGLVVLSDELQQYIEPEIKTGKDPIVPLFEIISLLKTRVGQMAFALLFSVPSKELGVINEQRGDLVQRLKENKLALDLTAIYNQTFAKDLWYQLAKVLAFEALRDKIVEEATLEALGQISARPDLATGPRTVVDAFNLMTARYKEANGTAQAFSPLDLVNAFLSNSISYDEQGKLQQVINGHLSHQFVQGKPEYQKAIKLMAAFPLDGLPERYWNRYGVATALIELTNETQGDVILYLGGGTDENGQTKELRAFLVGLEERKINTDWLTTTLREFRRNYKEGSPRMRELVVRGFYQLLRLEVFKARNWKLERSFEAGISQNKGCILEGGFDSTAKRYPYRRLHVRIIEPDGRLRDTNFEGDLAINFDLSLYFDQPENDRRYIVGGLSHPQDKVSTFRLNLSYNSGKENYGDLHNTLRPLFSPIQITPALLLSVYAYLDEKRTNNLIPKAEDDLIKGNFQPNLLAHALNELFNPALGEVYRAAAAKIVEEDTRRQLEQFYSQYKTFIITAQWKQNLREYRSALEKLASPFERQGQKEFDKGAGELAKLFAKGPDSIITFVSNHPHLIQKVSHNSWRFTLHALEVHVVNWLKGSQLPPKPPVNGKPRAWIKRDVSLKIALSYGYREEEFEEVLQLLEARGMITMNASRSEIIEEISKVLTVPELQVLVTNYGEILSQIKNLFADNPQLINMASEYEKLQAILKQQVGKATENILSQVEGNLKVRRRELDDFIEHQKNSLAHELGKLARQGLSGGINLARLEQAAKVGLFSNQLESQRFRLYKEAEEISTSVTPLEEQSATLIGWAGQSPIGVADFVKLVPEYAKFRDKRFKLEKRQEELKQVINHYTQAADLLSRAQGFEQRFTNLPEALAVEFTPLLEAWALQVSGDLSSMKLGGLAQVTVWSSDFETLSQQLEQKLAVERNHFAEIQTDYRNYLGQQYSQAKLWVEIVYNPTEPQDSYKRLWDGVHEVFKLVIEGIKTQVQAVYDRAVRLQGGSINNLPLEQRVSVQLELDQQIEKLTVYRGKTENWMTQASNPAFMDKARKQGANTSAELLLKPVTTRLAELAENLPAHNNEVSKIESIVRAATLTSAEQAALTILQNIAGSAALEGIELGLYLQELNAQGERDGWTGLAQLYAKQRLRIRIALVEF